MDPKKSKAWAANPFAQGASREGDLNDWDPFSEESSDQVVYETNSKANLFSLYQRALQQRPSRTLQVLEEASLLHHPTPEKEGHARQASHRLEPAVRGTQQEDQSQQIAKTNQLRPSQWGATSKDTPRQNRRPSLDTVGSFDSPVGWDDAPQEDFETLINRQAPETEPLPQFPKAKAPQNEAVQEEWPPPKPLPDPVTRREQPAIRNGRSFLDVARETWAEPPAELLHGGREARGFAEEHPFREGGSLGLGWSQQSSQPLLGKARKAAQRPKFSIRPQHRPSLTQAKSNIGIGLAPLAQQFKLLAESSGGIDHKRDPKSPPAASQEDTEQDDIEEQECQFAQDELPVCQAEEIDADDEIPLYSTHNPESVAPPRPNFSAVVPVRKADVHPRDTLPEPTQAGTSGRDLTSQFRNALQAIPDGGPLPTQQDWGNKQPVGVLAQLQRALQRQRNQELLFSKALQTGQGLEHDLRNCLDVRILETSMEAHLIKCRCEVLHEPQGFSEAGSSEGATVYVLVNRKAQQAAIFEPGRVVRIHPPWQHLVDTNGKRVIFNAICCHALQ